MARACSHRPGYTVTPAPASRIKPGAILWLPCEAHLNTQSFLQAHKISGDAFHHPALVIANDDTTANILLLTSFSHQDDNTVLPPVSTSYGSKRRDFAPISPTPANPESGDLLYLQGTNGFDRCSYVNMMHAYQVPRVWLTEHASYASTSLSLTAESIRLLSMRRTEGIKDGRYLPLVNPPQNAPALLGDGDHQSPESSTFQKQSPQAYTEFRGMSVPELMTLLGQSRQRNDDMERSLDELLAQAEGNPSGGLSATYINTLKDRNRRNADAMEKQIREEMQWVLMGIINTNKANVGVEGEVKAMTWEASVATKCFEPTAGGKRAYRRWKKSKVVQSH